MAGPAHIRDLVWVAKVGGVSHHRPRERRGAATRPARGLRQGCQRDPVHTRTVDRPGRQAKVYQKGRSPTVQNCTSQSNATCPPPKRKATGGFSADKGRGRASGAISPHMRPTPHWIFLATGWPPGFFLGFFHPGPTAPSGPHELDYRAARDESSVGPPLVGARTSSFNNACGLASIDEL